MYGDAWAAAWEPQIAIATAAVRMGEHGRKLRREAGDGRREREQEMEEEDGRR
jgi:hypothetical protein